MQVQPTIFAWWQGSRTLHWSPMSAILTNVPLTARHSALRARENPTCTAARQSRDRQMRSPVGENMTTWNMARSTLPAVAERASH